MSSIMPSRAIRFFSCLLLVAVLPHGAMAEEVQVAKAVLTLQQAADQEMAAKHYDAARKHVEAQDVPAAVAEYEKIRQLMPGTSDALNAESQIACLQVQSGNIEAAARSLEFLWSEYQHIEGFVESVKQIQDRYWISGKHQDSIALCRRLVTAFPDHAMAVDLQSSLVSACLYDDNAKQAAHELETFWERYKDREGFVEGAKHIQEVYWFSGKHQDSIALCRRLLTAFPDHAMAVDLQSSLISACLYVDDAKQAAHELEIFWERYKDREGFAEGAKQIQDAYWNSGKKQESVMLCQRLLTEFPRHSEAPLLCKDIIMAYLKMNQTAKMEEMIDYFSTLYSDTPKYLEAAQAIAWALRGCNDPGKSLEIYGQLLAQHPGHEDAIKIQAEITICYLELGAFDQIEKPLRVLSDTYQSHPDYVKTVNYIAWKCREYKHYAQAANLNRMVLALEPDSDEKLETCGEMAKALVWLEGEDGENLGGVTVDRSDVDKIVQQLMTEFSGAPRLGYHIFQIGEEYYFRGQKATRDGHLAEARLNFLKAINIWEMNINTVPDLHHRCLACYYSAITYESMKDYEKAVVHYEQAINQQHEYERRWHALSKLAECYNVLKNQQKMPENLANEGIRKAYAQLAVRYPECPASGVAMNWLKTK